VVVLDDIVVVFDLEVVPAVVVFVVEGVIESTTVELEVDDSVLVDGDGRVLRVVV